MDYRFRALLAWEEKDDPKLIEFLRQQASRRRLGKRVPVVIDVEDLNARVAMFGQWVEMCRAAEPARSPSPSSLPPSYPPLGPPGLPVLPKLNPSQTADHPPLRPPGLPTPPGLRHRQKSEHPPLAPPGLSVPPKLRPLQTLPSPPGLPKPSLPPPGLPVPPKVDPFRDYSLETMLRPWLQMRPVRTEVRMPRQSTETGQRALPPCPAYTEDATAPVVECQGVGDEESTDEEEAQYDSWIHEVGQILESMVFGPNAHHTLMDESHESQAISSPTSRNGPNFECPSVFSAIEPPLFAGHDGNRSCSGSIPKPFPRARRRERLKKWVRGRFLVCGA